MIPEGLRKNTNIMKHFNVVAAVVENRGKVLCMQRGMTKHPYTSLRWEFPGGKIEEGETEQDALRRELKEEMDYEVKIGEKICVVEHTYPDFSITMSAYLCSAKNRQFTMKEHVGSMWLKKEDIMELEWCDADIPIAKSLSALP